MRDLKFYISTLLLLSSVPYVIAYNRNDLVGSALEYEIDEKYFMNYFQDGNIATLFIGILCVIMFMRLRKKVSPVLRIIWITFGVTLILMPLFLMILGEGYSGIAIIFIFSYFLGFLGLAIILTGVLIYWMVMLIKFKSLRHSGKAVWNLLITGAGTVPLAYISAFGVFWIISLLAKDWNLYQCEKFVQSKWNEDFSEVPELMLEWEAEHLLQWGEKATRAKEEYYQDHNINFNDIEKKVKPDDSSEILYDLLWKTDSFKHSFNILKQRGWIILYDESGTRLFISPDKTKGYIQAKGGGNRYVEKFHYCFPQVSLANITNLHDIGGFDNVIVITTEANDTTKLYLRELHYMNNKFVSLKDSILALPDSKNTNIIPTDYVTYTLNEDYYDETEVLRFPTDTISKIVYEGEIIRVRFKNPEAKDKVYTHNCMIFVDSDFESGETRLRRF